MELIVNGRLVLLESEMTVGDYLEARGFNPKRIAVELNREILPKKNYDKVFLKQDDVMEIVTFVGGG